MKSMIITPKPSDPEVQILSEEFKKRGYEIQYFVPSSIKVRIENSSFGDLFNDLNPFGALVRGFGAAITQKIFFRLDLLSAMEEYGLKLINSRESLEIASDKFLTSLFLEKHRLPTPKTIVCENPEDAIIAFEELGGDIVIKPLYGSRGVGITRIQDKGFAENVIYTLGQLNEIYYLQEFVEHKNQDIRILVIGGKVIAGMYRVSDSWKTNIHAGATMKPIDMTKEMQTLAIKAAEVTKTEIAGIDLVETSKGLSILEVNSVPGFTALQKVTEVNLAEEMVDYFLKHA
ncbi:MAG: RimK family alpha-L-glutamate ligase [Candidatus Hermodarchaeota archaeon]